MGKPFKLVDTTFIEKALDATALRQQVISDNLANVNNPDYQAKSVAFDKQLREAMDHDNAKEHSIAWMNGTKKLRFEDRDGFVEDHGIIAVDTAVS